MTTDEPSGRRGDPVPGETVRHGTGVRANRAFPTSAHPQHLDPFVLFERFSIEPGQGFPMHPHRGFEIVSYMLDGGMDHEDSLGVEHTAGEGDAMHITAGEGIRHSEFPANGGCNGLQLWVNLPREQKDIEADYADASAGDLPTEESDDASVTTVVGEGSPLDTHTDLTYLDVRVADSSSWTWTLPTRWAGFLYGVEGQGTVDGVSFGEGDVLPVTPDDGREVTVESPGDAFRLVAVSGAPHDEPIRQQGPFVR